MTDPSPPTPNAGKWTAIAGAIVLLGICGMAFGLALAGWKPESIIGLVSGLTAVTGALLPVGYKTLIETNKQTSVLHEQSDVLHEISENTNGKLRAIIRQEVSRAVNPQASPGVSQRDTAA
jgi:hypothetical protein